MMIYTDDPDYSIQSSNILLQLKFESRAHSKWAVVWSIQKVLRSFLANQAILK